MLLFSRRARAALAVVAWLAVAPSTGAFGQAFDIHSPDAKAGEREVEVITGANLGATRGDPEFLRGAQQLKFNVGVTDFWRVELGALMEKPDADPLQLAKLTFENTFVLVRPPKTGVGLGLFAALDVATHAGQTNDFVFGPIVQLNADKASLLVNPYFVRSFGQNAGSGMDFEYIWRGKIELTQHFGIGAHGYGYVHDLGHGDVWNGQDHRLGPALFFETEVAPGRSVDITIGALFGLTHASPETAVLLNVGIPLPRR